MREKAINHFPLTIYWWPMDGSDLRKRWEKGRKMAL